MQALALTKTVWQGGFSFAKGIPDWMGWWWWLLWCMVVMFDELGHVGNHIMM